MASSRSMTKHNHPSRHTRRVNVPLQSVDRTTLSQQVAMRIAEAISVGRWMPGVRLPAEPDLCRVFAVGRSTIREAIKVLSYQGLLEIRRGQGTYVSNDPLRTLESLFRPDLLRSNETVDNFLEVRFTLELQAVRLSAERATQAELNHMQRIVDRMRRAEGKEEVVTLDIDFHAAIAKSTKNGVLSRILMTIYRYLGKQIAPTFEEADRQELTRKHHDTILKALRQRNPAKAESAMRNHLLTASLLITPPRRIRESSAKLRDPIR